MDEFGGTRPRRACRSPTTKRRVIIYEKITSRACRPWVCEVDGGSDAVTTRYRVGAVHWNIHARQTRGKHSRLIIYYSVL